MTRYSPVDKAVLFGSYAKGYATEQSDVDICFFLPDYHGKLRYEVMAELFGSWLPVLNCYKRNAPAFMPAP